MVFMPPDGAVVLLPCVPWNEHYQHIAASLQSLAGLLQGGLHVLVPGGAAYNSNFTLDPASCAALLRVVRSLDGEDASLPALLAEGEPCSKFAAPRQVPICGRSPSACFPWSRLTGALPQPDNADR
eukprot:TRINITY_DN24490_c0_g1_i6.p5 TRINITY_DN24490_c0_g1~~TRINITY_DN24490_c0_g1_i6.p5  ORF type:complete len:126 (-),score=21.63 TRINITY_DN24490_c0_g1_i6:417-794(-)